MANDTRTPASGALTDKQRKRLCCYAYSWAKKAPFEYVESLLARRPPDMAVRIDALMGEKETLENMLSKYRKSHACGFHYISNPHAQDRFVTYDERCTLCKEYDAARAAEPAAQKGAAHDA